MWLFYSAHDWGTNEPTGLVPDFLTFRVAGGFVPSGHRRTQLSAMTDNVQRWS